MGRLFRVRNFFVIVIRRGLWTFLAGRVGFSLYFTPRRFSIGVRVYQRVMGVSLCSYWRPYINFFRYDLT